MEEPYIKIWVIESGNTPVLLGSTQLVIQPDNTMHLVFTSEDVQQWRKVLEPYEPADDIEDAESFILDALELDNEDM